MRHPAWLCLFLAACSGPEADIRSADPYERFLGVRELEGRGDAAGLTEILERLEDPHYLVVVGAVLTLSEMREKAFLQHIAPLTTHPHPLVRGTACEGVGRLRNPEGIPFLLKALEDADPAVRRGAVKGLARFGDGPEVRRGLLGALGDADPGVALLAHESLKEITGRTDVARTRDAWTEALK